MATASVPSESAEQERSNQEEWETPREETPRESAEAEGSNHEGLERALREKENFDKLCSSTALCMAQQFKEKYRNDYMFGCDSGSFLNWWYNRTGIL